MDIMVRDKMADHHTVGKERETEAREREQTNMISELLGNQKSQEISTATEWLPNQKQNITEMLTFKAVTVAATWNKGPK